MQTEDEKTERKLELIDRSSQLFVTACHESGIDVSKVVPTGDEELKRRAYSDRYSEEAGCF